MKICALFVETCAVTGPGAFTYTTDLAWAWAAFTQETGVPAPADWLRALCLEHGVIVEEPAPGQYWRGWRLRGIALNPDFAVRFAAYRVARFGFDLLPSR